MMDVVISLIVTIVVGVIKEECIVKLLLLLRITIILLYKIFLCQHFTSFCVNTLPLLSEDHPVSVSLSLLQTPCH